MPGACALESVQHCADWLSIWAAFFFFAVSHKAAGKVERPHNQKVQRPEPNIALALPLTNWDSGQVTSSRSLPISEAVMKSAGVLTVFRQCWVSKTPGGVLSWDLTPLGSLVWGKPMHQTVLNARDFVAHPRQDSPDWVLVTAAEAPAYGALVSDRHSSWVSHIHYLTESLQQPWGSYYYYPCFPMWKLRLRKVKWLAF